MQLSSDEIQVIATAIIWRLYQVESAPEANLTDDDWQILRILLHELIDQKQACVFGDQQSVELDPQFPRYRCHTGEMKMPREYFTLLRDSLAQFIATFQHSPAEIEVQSGHSFSFAKSTAEKLEFAD